MTHLRPFKEARELDARETECWRMFGVADACDAWAELLTAQDRSRPIGELEFRHLWQTDHTRGPTYAFPEADGKRPVMLDTDHFLSLCPGDPNPRK